MVSILWGTVAAGWTGYWLNLPMWVHIPVTLISGMIAGSLWASIAGYLRAWWGVNEIFVTGRLNWIVIYVCNLFTVMPGMKKFFRGYFL